MLIEPLIQQLREMRLHGLAAALEQQLTDREIEAMRFEERLALMIAYSGSSWSRFPRQRER